MKTSFAASVQPGADFRSIPLEQIVPSPLNPRRSVTGDQLEELAESIREKGLLQPVLVRPGAKATGAAYELVCGHRRLAAAQLVGLEELPAIVRELDDQAVLEIQVVENLQRSDLHPLEEAESYRRLLLVKGYDVARIAEKIGRSVKYVYDRVKLLELTKEAKALFLDGKITAGHAILLARLKPADQARALSLNDRGIGGVFQAEQLLWNPDGSAESEEEQAVKPRSVRELQGWIDQHVRFDVHRDAEPMLFPSTAEALSVARIAPSSKIIPITHEHYVQPEARDKERIFGPRSWKRADGELDEDIRTGRKAKSKTCEKSGLGVIVVGPGRGDAFQVCVNRSCEVHFPAQAKKAKAAASSKPAGPPKPDRWEIERQKRDELQARWKKALPEILKAVAERVKKASAHRGGALCNLLVDHLKPNSGGSAPASYVQLGSHPEDVVRFAAWLVIYEQAGAWLAWEHFPKLAGKFGVDVRKILKAAAPPQTPESGSATTRPKRGAKKGGKR